MRRLFTLLTVVLLPIWADEAAAQASGVGIDVENISAKRIACDNVYSIKFVCGQQNVPNIGSVPSSFVPGRYRTAINLHNPEPYSVQFTVRGVRTQSAYPPSAGGHVGAPVPESLGAGQGLEISCEDIMTSIGETNQDIFINFLFTGFVTVQTGQRNDLDIVGVYTVTVSGAGVS